MSSSFCTKCGAALGPGVQFCTVCGAPVSSAKSRPEQRICPGCGKPLKPNTKFCTSCGANLEQLDSAAVRPQAQASEGVSAAALAAGSVPRDAGGLESLTGAAAPAAPARPKPRAAAPDGQSSNGQGAVRPGGVAPRRSIVCPKCGNTVQPGRTVCGVCGTAVTAARAPMMREPDDLENEIHESRNRTGLWITLAAVGLVIIAIAAVVLIFWDKLFQKQEEEEPPVTEDYGLVTSLPDTRNPFEVETEETEESQPLTETWPTEETEPETEPSTEAPTAPPTQPPTQPPTEPPTEHKLSWDDVKLIISAVYDLDALKLAEDSNSFTVGVCEKGTDHVLGVVRVDKTTGERTVIEPIQEPQPPESSDESSEQPPDESSDESSEQPPDESSDESSEQPPEDSSEEPPEPVADDLVYESCAVDGVEADAVEDRMTAEIGDDVPYAFAAIDLFSGLKTGAGAAEEPMSSSVLIGIPILYAVNQELEAGNLTLDSKVPVVSGKSARGSLNGVDEMTVGELLQRMLRYSSGDAICTLMDCIGKDRINQICHQNGFSSVGVNNYIGETVDNTDSDNYVSAADVCGILYSLYNGEGDLDRTWLRENFGIIEGSYQNSGLGSELEGVIGSFNGVKGDKFNEVVLVERNGRAYVMALFSNGAAASDIMSGMRDVGVYVDEAMMQ